MTVRRSLGAGVAWMAFGVRAEALAPAMDVGLAPAAGHDLSTAADAELGPSADAKVDLAEDLEQGEEQSSGSKIWHNHKRSELLADAYMFKVVCIFNVFMCLNVVVEGSGFSRFSGRFYWLSAAFQPGDAFQ
ncbi:unnamed protein product [Prorocentrum cordatum]|uniref:Uncharacterized protein n=1 Tax=Prorocentrum cordatum TaxID=2364126 RepID=A0ABN9WL88_9DINO|nr:unnamed protein product [Polarella glacialis]